MKEEGGKNSRKYNGRGGECRKEGREEGRKRAKERGKHVWFCPYGGSIIIIVIIVVTQFSHSALLP
ncbi:hypothetical protein EYF80_015093 [Liparis tanakae]|uniref:Uncharacterized protein n=1 Tax=Liparis tanakae TaxID=230148 RepID=A0A4Z2IBE4_9TELE|nr:hypothetical protein EYF80_015093 [Liparis tanakae]